MYVTPADVSRDVEETLLRAEEAGLELAIIGRTIALVLLGIWLLASRADDPARLFNYSVALSVFAGFTEMAERSALSKRWRS